VGICAMSNRNQNHQNEHKHAPPGASAFKELLPEKMVSIIVENSLAGMITAKS